MIGHKWPNKTKSATVAKPKKNSPPKQAPSCRAITKKKSTVEAKAMQCTRYPVCTDHWRSMLSFTRCHWNGLRCRCRAVKAKTPPLLPCQVVLQIQIRNKANTQDIISGIFTTLPSLHMKKRYGQQWFLQCKCGFPSQLSIFVCGSWLS
jgi:hypothetical protein